MSSYSHVQGVEREDTQTHQAIAEFFAENFPYDHYPQDESEGFVDKYGSADGVGHMYEEYKRWDVLRTADHSLSAISLIGERALGQIHVFWVIVDKESRGQGLGSKLVQASIDAPNENLLKTEAEGATPPETAVITASIKEGNVASEGLFRAIGFTRTSAEQYLAGEHSELEFNRDGTMDLWTKKVSVNA
jgi:ribosomal protein S18 acetylase RimI-like enzyme